MKPGILYHKAVRFTGSFRIALMCARTGKLLDGRNKGCQVYALYRRFVFIDIRNSSDDG